MLGKGIVSVALVALFAVGSDAITQVSESQTPSRTGTRTRTPTRTPSTTASHTASETRTPSVTPSNTPSPTPIVCSSDRKLVSVELFSNFPHDNHYGDDLDAVLTVPCRNVPNPILDGSSVITRRQLGAEEALANPVTIELSGEALREQEASRGLHYFVPTPSPTPNRPSGWDFGEYYNGTTYGGVVLTDQQPVAITFTSPCWDWPCTFGLKRLAMVLHNLPRYNLPWDAAATVFFKIELGRYYTNLPPPVVPSPYRRNLKETEEPVQRQLTSSPSFFEPYVDIQTTVWSENIIVRANQTLFNLDLSGLYYTVWRESPFVEAGLFKLIITPYIHYDSDTSQPDQILWLLNQPAWNSFPQSDFHFSRPESFIMRPGCPAHHGIMSNSGRQLLAAEEAANSSNANGVVPVEPGSRALNDNAWSWWPDICILRQDWACVPFYPSIQLEALLPCAIVFSAVRDEIFNQREGEENIQVEIPVYGRRLHSQDSWNHRNFYYSIDCPPDYDGEGIDPPFFGVDTTAFGRYLSPNDHAIRTVDLTGTVEHTDLLFVFQAPCTRCNIYLRELWLPLARDPLCAGEIHFHTHLGFWNGNGIDGDYYEGSTFTPSVWANGVHTVMTLGTHLAQNGIFLGSFDHKARIDIPYYGNGSVTWIAIRVTTSSCVRLGTGLDQSSQSLCVESPITPAALFHGAETPGNGSALLPTRQVWLNSGVVPGLFSPVIKVETWQPICIPILPSPSPRPSNVPSRSPGASASPTAPGGSPSRTPTATMSAAPTPSNTLTSTSSISATSTRSRNPPQAPVQDESPSETQTRTGTATRTSTRTRPGAPASSLPDTRNEEASPSGTPDSTVTGTRTPTNPGNGANVNPGESPNPGTNGGSAYSPNPGIGASGTLQRVGGLSTDNSASSGLLASIGAGGIAGIVIAAVAGAILVAAAVVVVLSRRSAAAAASSAAYAVPSAVDDAASASGTTGEAPARSPAGSGPSSRPSATSP